MRRPWPVLGRSATGKIGVVVVVEIVEIVVIIVVVFVIIIIEVVRTAIAQWLRCCATNRKVAVSIPYGVTGIFH